MEVRRLCACPWSLSGGLHAPSSTGRAELELLMELSSRQHYSARVRSLAPVSSTQLDGGSIAGGGWSRQTGQQLVGGIANSGTDQRGRIDG